MIWLSKTEPGEYSLNDLEREGSTTWGGIRNPTALRHLRAMATGDLVLIYHTGKERAIVGFAEVVQPAAAGPSGAFSAVISFRGRFARPVTLAELKALPELARWELVRIPRLSHMPVPAEAWRHIRHLAGALSLPDATAPQGHPEN